LTIRGAEARQSTSALGQNPTTHVIETIMFTSTIMLWRAQVHEW
jgi:hypothetical protein